MIDQTLKNCDEYKYLLKKNSLAIYIARRIWQIYRSGYYSIYRINWPFKDASSIIVTSPLEIFFFNFGIRSNSYIMCLTQRKRKLAPCACILGSKRSIFISGYAKVNRSTDNPRPILHANFSRIFQTWKDHLRPRVC